MDFEKAMNFILEQMAQVAVRQQKADEEAAQRRREAVEVKKEADARMAKIEAVVLRLANATHESVEDSKRRDAALADAHARLADATKESINDMKERNAALIDAHIRLADAQARTEDELRRLAEAQRRTDERLNMSLNKADDERDEAS